MSRTLRARRPLTLLAAVTTAAASAVLLVGPASARPSSDPGTRSTGEPASEPTSSTTSSAGRRLVSSLTEQAAATVVYRVSPLGDDAGPGSAVAPWRSLSRVSRAALPPGAVVLLDRGARYQGTLSLGSSGTAARPIRVAATGVGAAPVIENGDCLQLRGAYLTVSDLMIRNCSWSGVSIQGDHDTVTGLSVTGNVAGVHVTQSASDARVVANQIYDNRRLSPGKDGPNDDSGVNGVIVQGTRTSITGNRISGHQAPSPDYGIEGSAVEVYGAHNTVISGNSSIDDATFVELGERTTSNTRITRNTVTSVVPRSYFIVTRGAADSFGPVRGTVVDHNSAAMNGAGGGGLICYAGCSPTIVSASDNVIVATQKPTWSDGSGIGGGNNILVDDSDPRTARPTFINRRTDLRLVANSTAIDAAGACRTPRIDVSPYPALGASSAWCRDGDADGRSGLDIGALER